MSYQKYLDPGIERISQRILWRGGLDWLKASGDPDPLSSFGRFAEENASEHNGRDRDIEIPYRKPNDEAFVVVDDDGVSIINSDNEINGDGTDGDKWFTGGGSEEAAGRVMGISHATFAISTFSRPTTYTTKYSKPLPRRR